MLVRSKNKTERNIITIDSTILTADDAVCVESIENDTR